MADSQRSSNQEQRSRRSLTSSKHTSHVAAGDSTSTNDHSQTQHDTHEAPANDATTAQYLQAGNTEHGTASAQLNESSSYQVSSAGSSIPQDDLALNVAGHGHGQGQPADVNEVITETGSRFNQEQDGGPAAYYPYAEEVDIDDANDDNANDI